MDKVDIKILDMVQKNGRVPNTEIAKALKMAPSGTLERVRKLERAGVIKGYHAKIDEFSVGCPLLAFVWVKVNQANWPKEISDAICKIVGVQGVFEVTGEFSYLVKIRVADIESLSRILKLEFGEIKGILYTQTIIALKTLKDDPTIPLVNALK